MQSGRMADGRKRQQVVHALMAAETWMNHAVFVIGWRIDMH